MSQALEHCPAKLGRAVKLASIAQALVLVLALVSLSSPRYTEPGESGAECAGRCVEAELATERWNDMWQEISAQGAQALAPEVTAIAARPAGDTLFMRYPNQWGEVDAVTRLSFQLAALANDPKQKIKYLARLERVPAPRVRHRAYLEHARVALRSRHFDAAMMAARSALKIAEVPGKWQADPNFVLAHSAWETGELELAEHAVNAAVAADPGFWDARDLRARLNLRLLSKRGQPTAACIDRARRLIEDLGALPQLAEDRGQFGGIARRIIVVPGRANAARYLAAGMGYLWQGDSLRAREELRRAAHSSGALPRGCEALINAQASAWLPKV